MTELRSPSAFVLNTIFFVLVAAYCVWVFSFPLFPTQDGAVHLYYINVIHHLMQGSELFGHYFFVKWPPPPYVLHYAFLLGLTSLLPALTAEKFVVAGCIVLFCFGARFFLSSVSDHFRLLSLFLVPVSLNWMLGMGFHNYCLSLGMSLFALGCWLKGARSGSWTMRSLFIALIFLMLFTHPVPLMVTLVTVSGELAVRILQPVLARTSPIAHILRRLSPDLVLLLVAYCSLAYIALFVSGNRTGENLHNNFLEKGLLIALARAKPLLLVYKTWPSVAYRLWLIALAAVCVLAGLAGVIRNFHSRVITSANFFAICSAAVFLLLPFIPRSINGSDFFADRLFIYPFVFALAGCSAEIVRFRQFLKPAVAGAVLAAFAVLAIDDGPMRHDAKNLAQLETSAITNPGPRGMFVENPVIPTSLTSFEPYVWSAARYFRVTGSVMMNAPWLDLPISPLGARNDHFGKLLPPSVNNYPYRVLEEISDSQSFRDLVEPKVNFILQIGSAARSTPADLARSQWTHGWSCEKEAWFSVCRRTP